MQTPTTRILVLDDDPDLRTLCADVLIRSGYEVDTATDGEAGWRAIEAVKFDSDSYDLLITNHNMPKLPGLELVRKLRAARMELPVILVSGSLPGILVPAIDGASLKQLEWNRSLQIDATLPKPYTIEQLVGTVKEVLRTVESDGQSINPAWRL